MSNSGFSYEFHIHKNRISSIIQLPFDIELTQEQAEKLENELHDSLEQIFKQFWNK